MHKLTFDVPYQSRHYGRMDGIANKIHCFSNVVVNEMAYAVTCEKTDWIKYLIGCYY